MNKTLQSQINQLIFMSSYQLVNLIFFATFAFFFTFFSPEAFAQDTFDASRVELATCKIVTFIQGSFGALIMVVAGIVTIISAAVGAYRIAISILIVGIASFILPALITLFFPVNCEEEIQKHNDKSGVTAAYSGGTETNISTNQRSNAEFDIKNNSFSNNSSSSSSIPVDLKSGSSSERIQVFTGEDLYPNGRWLYQTGKKYRVAKRVFDSEEIDLKDLIGQPVVLEWYSPTCTSVDKHYRSNYMQGLQKTFQNKGVVWLTINSSSFESSGYLDPFESSRLVKAREMNSTFYILDATGRFKNKFQARITPQVIILNKEGNQVYSGAIDDNSDPYANPYNDSQWLKNQLEAVLIGRKTTVPQTEPYGCKIK